MKVITMMKKLYFHFFLLLLTSLGYTSSHAAVIKVSSLADAGPGTLRNQIGAAGIGDTVLIDVKGTINLLSQIGIPAGKNVVVIGPYPIHCTINVSAYTFSSAFDVDPTATFKLKGVTITGGTGINGYIIASGQVEIYDCVFLNHTGTANGGGVSVGSATANVKIQNCSFIGNQPASTSGGGGVFMFAGTVNLINCTFYGNKSPKGGAVFVNGGALNVLHCTFYLNEATTGSSGGHTIFCQAGNITLQNSIVAHNSGPFTECFANVGGTWTSFGGNIIRRNPGGFLSPLASDLTNSLFSALDPDFSPGAPITDGYGLKYLRIGNASSAIERGVTTGGSIVMPPTDCRRAPRILKGSSTEAPDAGAVEYTPFTVTSAANFMPQWTNMNTFLTSGPKYMDFDISSSINIPMASTAAITDPGAIRIVDGYTAQGSAIAGPRDPAMIGEFITPANIFVNYISSATTFDLEGLAAGSWIAGLKIDNGAGQTGIAGLDIAVHFYGNQIISSSTAGLYGIRITGFSQVKIGGRWVHEGNVFSGQFNGSSDACGINIDGTVNGFISGNLIGTTTNGLGILQNRQGIYMNVSGNLLIGGNRFDYSRNVIGGNNDSNIKMIAGTGAIIKGNYIGVNISGGANLTTTTLFGAKIESNTEAQIGGILPGEGNVFGGHDIAVFIQAANAVDVFGNYIGISPNTGFPVVNNDNGIWIENNGAATHKIGDGTPAGRNYISGNDIHGISVNNSHGNLIQNNFIGIKPNNGAQGNGGWGIEVNGAGCVNNTIDGNVISANGLDGIFYDGGAGQNNTIKNNKVGTDSTGAINMGNSAKGIYLTNYGNNLLVDNNLVSGNLQQGMQLENGTVPITITNNTVGLNLSKTAPMANLYGITGLNVSNVNIIGNTVSGNTNDGLNFNALLNSTIKGNYIGTTSANAILSNGFNGILLVSSNEVTIGGVAAAEQNSIAYNAEGVFIDKTTKNININGNHFIENSGRGINLDNGSPLPNDAGDADVSGGVAGNKGNDGQNKPDNLSATICAGTTTVSGTMNVDDASATYIINVYKVTIANIDPSGAGEGDTLIGSMPYPTPGTPTFPINIPLGTSLALGDVLSLTCTKSAGGFSNTSEFSDTVMIRGPFTANAAVVTNATCNGLANGSATVTHTATMAPFTFQWVNATTGIPVSGATSATVSILPAGNYYCNVTDGTSCVIGSDTITILEPLALSFGVTENDETCGGYNNGSIISVPTGGTPPYDFNLYNSSSVLINADIDSLSSHINNLAPDTYPLQIIDNNGCVYNFAAVISASANFMNANFNTLGSACENSPMSFGDLSTSSPIITSWIWDFGDGIGTSTLQNPNYTYSTAGTYSVELLVSNGGCTDSVTLTVTVDPVPVANAGANASICLGSSYLLDGGASSGTSLSYTWNEVATGITVGTSVSVGVAPTGTTFYELELFNGFCVDRDTMVLTVNPPDDSTFSYPTDSICTNNGTQTPITASPGGVFTVTPPGLSFSGITGAIDPSISAPGSYVITYTTAGACPTSFDQTIHILPIPTGTVTATSGTVFCLGDLAPIDLNFTGSPSFTYEIVEGGVGSGFFTTSSTFTFGATTSGLCGFQNLTDANGCVNTALVSVNLTFSSPPDPFFSYGVSNLCTGDAPITPSSATTGGTYGLVTGSGLSLATDGTIDPSTSTPGTYLVYHEFTLPCYSSDTVSIVIDPSPVVSISDFHKACWGDTVNFVGSPAGGTWSGPAGLNATTGQWLTFSVFPGTYTATYTFTNVATGCTSQDTNLVVLVTPPVVSVTPSLASTYCLGEPSVNLSGLPSGPGPGYFYYEGAITSGSSYIYTPSALGPDTLYYYYVDPVTGCDNVSAQITNVVSTPATPILSPGPYIFCETAPSVVSVSNPTTVVNWYSDASLSSLVATGASVSSTSFPPGSGAIYVVNSTGGSCASPPASFTYTVYSTAALNLGGPYTTCPSTPVLLSTNIPTTGVSFYWVNNGTINDTFAINPIVTPVTTTTYYVIISPSALPTCTLIDSVTVTVEPCDLQNITNVFTPDGDGVNDTWYIDGIQAYPKNRVAIFNRWGDRLIDISNYNNVDQAWDGMYNGSKVAVGTYYYVIEIPDQSIQASGWVQVNY